MSVKRKLSAIWLHYIDDGEQRAKCKYCCKSISIAGGSHGNLNRHFRIKHQITHTMQTFNNNTQIVNPQPNTTHNVRKPSRVSRNVKQIDKQVLKMIVKGHHSLGIVEEPEFKKLVQVVSRCPGYNLPTKTKMSINIMPSVRNELLKDIKCKIHSASAICLSTECWLSKMNRNYLSVTVHYIDEETQLRSHLISCNDFAESEYTADALSSFLNKTITDFEITNKITAIVSNNSEKISTAVRQGQWRRIGCFAHSLDLIVQAVLVEFDDIVKVRRIVDYYHSNADSLKELLKAQKQLDLLDFQLLRYEHDHWNFTYEMLHSIDVLKDAVTMSLPQSRPDLVLSLDDWQLLSEIVRILKPFNEIAVEISKENNLPLSKAKVICKLLESFVFNCRSTNEKVSCLLLIMKKELIFRFRDIERNSLYAESTILDPRFKRSGFKNSVTYENAMRSLRSKICLINNKDNKDEISSHNSKEVLGTDMWQDFISNDDSSVWNDFDQYVHTTCPADDDIACMRELDKYLKDEVLERNKDPLEWWSERKYVYPSIYSYALQRLCITATSVPCEMIYTASGQTIRKSRDILNSQEVSNQVFLHNNI